MDEENITNQQLWLKYKIVQLGSFGFVTKNIEVVYEFIW